MFVRPFQLGHLSLKVSDRLSHHSHQRHAAGGGVLRQPRLLLGVACALCAIKVGKSLAGGVFRLQGGLHLLIADPHGFISGGNRLVALGMGGKKTHHVAVGGAADRIAGVGGFESVGPRLDPQ